jgi:AraC-like DNA-binding protein
MVGNEPYIQGHAIMGLHEFIAERGGDSNAMLQAVGLPVANYDRPELIVSYRKIGALLEEAAKQLNMPCFGADCVFNMPKHVPFLAPFVMLAKFEHDCGAWLRSVQRYLKIHTNGFVIELIAPQGSSTSRLRYVSDPLTSLSKQLASSVLAKAVVAGQIVTGRSDLRPQCIFFRHAGSTTEKKTLEQLFQCEVQFNSEHDEIEFDNNVLALPTHGTLSVFKSLMNLYVRWQIARVEAKHISHTTMVSLAISSALGTGQANIIHVSETLDWNPKKLQRLLAEEDISFSDILDQARKNTAIALLKNSAIPVSKIAGMLDYAGSPPFNLAFRRWTGQSPMEFRKRR